MRIVAQPKLEEKKPSVRKRERIIVVDVWLLYFLYLYTRLYIKVQYKNMNIINEVEINTHLHIHFIYAIRRFNVIVWTNTLNSLFRRTSSSLLSVRECLFIGGFSCITHKVARLIYIWCSSLALSLVFHFLFDFIVQKKSTHSQTGSPWTWPRIEKEYTHTYLLTTHSHIRYEQRLQKMRHANVDECDFRFFLFVLVSFFSLFLFLLCLLLFFLRVLFSSHFVRFCIFTLHFRLQFRSSEYFSLLLDWPSM